eukprot:403377424
MLNPNPSMAQVNEYKEMYRRMTNAKKDLKNFKLLVYMNKESIKTTLTEDNKVQLAFKVDANCDCSIRVNTCVTEKRNLNNVPEMMYTPNKDNYSQEVYLKAGLHQEIPFTKCQFDLNYMVGFELYKNFHNYYPIVFSINYQSKGKLYAFIIYGYFNKDGNSKINGVHIVKQLVIINGIPFEIKNIYGLDLNENADETVQGESAEALVGSVTDDGEGKECLICLSEPKDTLIMPCGHICVCSDCGNQIQQKKYTCPVCRGTIGSLIPVGMLKKAKKT